MAPRHVVRVVIAHHAQVGRRRGIGVLRRRERTASVAEANIDLLFHASQHLG